VHEDGLPAMCRSSIPRATITKSDSQKAIYPSSLSQLSGMHAVVSDISMIVPMQALIVIAEGFVLLEPLLKDDVERKGVLDKLLLRFERRVRHRQITIVHAAHSS